MLAKRLLQYHLEGDRVVPHWLDASDDPWMGELLESLGHHVGLSWGRWHDRKRSGWTVPAPEGKRAMALAVLEKSVGGKRPDGVSPAEVRAAVFTAAEATRGLEDGRNHALASAARSLGLPVEQVERALFGDLPDERTLVLREALPDAATLIERVNLALVQGLLRQSTRVEIALRGHARPVVRQILLRRLIAVARPDGSDAVRIEVSGVYDLFRRTTLYGRALGSIVPILSSCPRYRLDAELVLGSRTARLQLTEARRFSARLTRRYDSKLEERFARDVDRQLPDWELVREPSPVQVDGTLVFPDFEVRHRSEPTRRALVEIVGFWTADYLATKAGRLERSGRTDLILCVDEDRCTTARQLAPSLRIVPFKRRIDPHAVVAAIDAAPVEETRSDVRRIEIRDLFIDFAGRQPLTDPLHDVLEALQPGDPVQLVPRRGRIAIEVRAHTIGLLGRGGNQRHGPFVGSPTPATVARKTKRRASASGHRYRGLLRCPTWWLVEVVYEVRSGA